MNENLNFVGVKKCQKNVVLRRASVLEQENKLVSNCGWFCKTAIAKVKLASKSSFLNSEGVVADEQGVTVGAPVLGWTLLCSRTSSLVLEVLQKEVA